MQKVVTTYSCDICGNKTEKEGLTKHYFQWDKIQRNIEFCSDCENLSPNSQEEIYLHTQAIDVLCRAGVEVDYLCVERKASKKKHSYPRDTYVNAFGGGDGGFNCPSCNHHSPSINGIQSHHQRVHHAYLSSKIEDQER